MCGEKESFEFLLWLVFLAYSHNFCKKKYLQKNCAQFYRVCSSFRTNKISLKYLLYFKFNFSSDSIFSVKNLFSALSYHLTDGPSLITWLITIYLPPLWFDFQCSTPYYNPSPQNSAASLNTVLPSLSVAIKSFVYPPCG